MGTDDEDDLISRSKVGDWDAYARLIRIHQRMIHSLTYRMSGSMAESEDLAQETFIRAYRGLGDYRGAAKFSSWLYRVAINVCLQWQRAERRRAKVDGEWARSTGPESAGASDGERVQEALNMLPAKQRAAVILTLYEGMTHSEAAAVLGCPERTVSWRMFAARRRLAQLLKEEAHEHR